MGLMDKDGDGNIDYQEFVRVGQMKTELNDMQAKAQSDNQALAQELTNIAQEKCEAQISQLRQLLEDKTTRLSGTDQVRARERVSERGRGKVLVIITLCFIPGNFLTACCLFLELLLAALLLLCVLYWFVESLGDTHAAG